MKIFTFDSAFLIYGQRKMCLSFLYHSLPVLFLFISFLFFFCLISCEYLGKLFNYEYVYTTLARSLVRFNSCTDATTISYRPDDSTVLISIVTFYDP